MQTGLTLMAVHAHPDDEAISTGGVLVRYAEEGVQTVLVTCTGGEVGEIADPAMATAETLGEVRRQELEAACRILNVGHLHLLGYRDSGMAGTPANDHPESFNQADLNEATGKLVELVRLYRPQVLVTYDDEGFYGHPDHINANRITVAAFEAAADPARFPRTGPPWQPLKLYYVAIARSRAALFAQRMREAGITPPFEAPEGAEPEFGTPDEQVTTSIDVLAQVERKHRALLAHATQMGPEVFFAQLPEAIFHEIFGMESFRLVRTAEGHHRPGCPEDDLFAGLRQ